MNEKHELEHVIGEVSIITVLMVLVLCLVAPVLGPWIRRQKVRAYALYPDWEQRVKADMVGVYIGLWLVAIVAWVFVAWCNLNG